MIITITAYNKTVLAARRARRAGRRTTWSSAATPQLTVDARGTGSSEGVWEAFSPRETKDYGAVVAWAHRQPWSNGKSGMTGPSYMGIAQLFAAAAHPPGLKAIFPQVPGADVYRDIVASGGQIDVSFIPLWMGLVTGTGLIPPAYGGDDPASAIQALLDRLTTATTFTGPLLASAVLGGDPAYDGQFYKDRSPINVIKQVKVPTFLVSGEYDLFQRGTPLLFEKLQKRGVPVRMITGPWDHLQGSSGDGRRQGGLRVAAGAVAAVVRPLREGQEGRQAAQGRQAVHLLRAGHRQVGHDQEVRRPRPARRVVPALGSAAARRPERRPGAERQEGAARHVDGAADPGHRAVHALGEPVDRRHPQPGVAGQPVPEGQPAQRPRRPELPDRAAEEGAAAPGADERAALRVLAER